MAIKKGDHKNSVFSLSKIPFYFLFDLLIIGISAITLLFNILGVFKGNVNTIVLAAVSIIGLWPVMLSAVKALINRRPTIDLLASIALIFSLFAKEWQSAAFITLMLASARLFARYTENQAKSSIKSLLKLRPTQVRILIDGKPVETDAEKIKVGDRIAVESGERIAVDGLVESGEANIDQSSLTGESEPILKKAGDQVLSSTLNIGGSLIIKATKIGKDTTFARILELVEKSQESKIPIYSITEHFTKWYISLTLIGALIIYYFSRDLRVVLAILLVTCADDIAVAIPLAFTAAIGTAAKWGIIIKGGSFLEGLTKTKMMVFDKTGTLTEGKMKVQNMVIFNDVSPNVFLANIGTLESESDHPSAKAVCEFVAGKGIKLLKAEEVHEEPGYGIGGKINNELVLAGKARFLEKNGIKFSEKELGEINVEKNKNRTVMTLSIGKKAAGFLSYADNIRASAENVMADLKTNGLGKLVMLTGDNEKVAADVATKIKMTDFKANLMPQDKIDYLKEATKPDYKVAMIGDGVNDAPALAMADIGIAMGAIGSDAAIENADIILMKDDLTNILDTIKLGRYTMKIVYQNIVIWAVLNLLGLILVFAKVLGPSGAAAYNFITDFFPLLNSLKLFRLHLYTRQKRLNYHH